MLDVVVDSCLYTKLVYQSRIPLPHRSVIIVATARKGPKGIGSFPFLNRNSSRVMATSPPLRIPNSRATNTNGKPVANPMRPARVTSPSPIPPPMLRYRQSAKRYAAPIKTTPTAPPKSAFRMPMLGQSLKPFQKGEKTRARSIAG